MVCDRLFRFYETATFEGMPQPLKDAYLKVTPNPAGLINMFNKDKQRMIGFKDIIDEAIGNIKPPVLVMVADQDMITIEYMVAMSRLVHGANLIVLPGTHGQFFGEMGSINDSNKTPQTTALLIREFLKKESLIEKGAAYLSGILSEYNSREITFSSQWTEFRFSIQAFVLSGLFLRVERKYKAG